MGKEPKEEMEYKSFKDLTYADDFLFAKVMRNKKICKGVLEVLLDFKIRDIKYPEEQKAIKITRNSKGVRLDVYVEDDKHTVYNIEMQTTASSNLPKRSRYYQGMIELNHIEKGEDYRKLNNSFVIFICLEDPFKKGLPRYTFKEQCLEEGGIEFEDGTTKVFLNASAALKAGNAKPTALIQFLKYVASGKAESELCQEIAEEVEKAKTNQGWEVEYMTLNMMLKEEFENGVESMRKVVDKANTEANKAKDEASKANAEANKAKDEANKAKAEDNKANNEVGT